MTRTARRMSLAVALAAVLAPVVAPAQPLAGVEIPAPQAHWSFDELTDGLQVAAAAGHRPADIVRSERLAGDLVAELVPGVRGRALVCGGSQQYGVFAGVTDPGLPAGPFTVALWLKPTQAQWITRPLYAKSNWLSRDGWELQMSGDRLSLVLCPRGAQERTRVWVTSRYPMALGHWAFVAVRWDGAEWTLLVNGAPAAQEDAPELSYVPPAPGVPLNLGGYSVHTNNVFCGLLDEARVWDGALSDEQIAAVMVADISGE